MSSKLPYYRMHPKDFDSDENVRLMGMCELGLYIRCLNHAWVNGSIPDDPTKIAKITGFPLREVKKSWPAVSKCFTKSDGDVLVNLRLERERKWAIERSDKLQKNWEKRGPEKPPKSTCQEGETKGETSYTRASESESESGSESFSQEKSAERNPSFDPLADNLPPEAFAEEIATTETIIRCWNNTRGLPRLSGADRKLIHANPPTITEDDLTGGLPLFAARVKELGDVRSPIRMFLKNPLGWRLYGQFSETKQAPAETPVPKPKTPTAVEISWQSDVEFQAYLWAAADKGKRLTPAECASAHALFLPLTPEQRTKSTADYAYLGSTASEPKYIPGPVNHLRSQPWLVLRKAVPTTKAEKAQSESEARQQRIIARYYEEEKRKA